MISRHFMATHPCAGQPTHFKEKILHGQNANPGVIVITNRRDVHASDISDGGKIHTIRSNYDHWKAIADKVNAGEAILSLRQWTGSPYNRKRDGSKQVEILQLTKMGVQRVSLHNGGIVFKEDDRYRSFTWVQKKEVATNDGLSFEDFWNWFCPPLKNPAKGRVLNFEGCVIHFTEFKY